MEEKQKDLVHIHEALDFWFGPSWIWTSVDILPTNLQSVPINRSGIDPGRIHIIYNIDMDMGLSIINKPR